MIWIRGDVVPDEEVRVGALDRAFEHGLGLFETFRTWNGHPTLLERHLERLCRSAAELGLNLDPRELPDGSAVLRLIETTRGLGPGDVRLRIVASGGAAVGARAPDRSSVWMTAGPLPPGMERGARIGRTILADPDDPLARHKTLNYWRRRIELARAAAEGTDEVLCVTPGGLICEGTRSNLFLVRDGDLIAPGADGPLLAGVMRRVVIEQAESCGIRVMEGSVPLDAIASADEAFLSNSVRGMLPVARLLSADLPAPGPVTQRLWDWILPWLNSGGTTR